VRDTGFMTARLTSFLDFAQNIEAGGVVCMNKKVKLVLNEKLFPSMRLQKVADPSDPRFLNVMELDNVLDYLEDFAIHLELQLKEEDNKNQRIYLKHLDKFIRRMRVRLMGKELCEAFERDLKMLRFEDKVKKNAEKSGRVTS